jgi:hypothetical protein
VIFDLPPAPSLKGRGKSRYSSEKGSNPDKMIFVLQPIVYVKHNFYDQMLRKIYLLPIP